MQWMCHHAFNTGHVFSVIKLSPWNVLVTCCVRTLLTSLVPDAEVDPLDVALEGRSSLGNVFTMAASEFLFILNLINKIRQCFYFVRCVHPLKLQT